LREVHGGGGASRSVVGKIGYLNLHRIRYHVSSLGVIEASKTATSSHRNPVLGVSRLRRQRSSHFIPRECQISRKAILMHISEAAALMHIFSVLDVVE